MLLKPNLNRRPLQLSRIMVLAMFVGLWSLCAISANIKGAMVRVKVTSQSHNFLQPWEKRSPSSKRGIGALIHGNRVLVTASLVGNATFVELEDIETGDKMPAVVDNVDYLANLAVLRPEDKGFLLKRRPLQVREKSSPGDAVQVWQFESNGTPAVTEGTIKRIEVTGYPTSASAMLSYKLRATLATVGDSYTLPIVQRNRLVGMLMNHDQSNQTLTTVPGPIIGQYLRDLDDGDYVGFPRAGFGFASLDDPELRRFVGIEDNDSGIYVTSVEPGSAADRGGLEVGDVMTSIGKYVIDKFGQYNDPDFGRQSIANITSLRHVAGDQVLCHILRNGEQKTLPFELQPVDTYAYPVPPFIIDRAPNYVVFGGLVIQELSQELLRSWGGNWRTSAPQRLVHISDHQWEYAEPGERIIVMTHVLPAPVNIGYRHLRLMPISTINGQSIKQLADITAALQKPENGVHQIDFEAEAVRIVLDAEGVAKSDPIIQRLYGLPALARMAP